MILLVKNIYNDKLKCIYDYDNMLIYLYTGNRYKNINGGFYSYKPNGTIYLHEPTQSPKFIGRWK